MDVRGSRVANPPASPSIALPSRNPAVDGLRAIAVLAVLGFHAVAGGAPSVGAPHWASCGERGVDLFFAISGFCLAYPFLRDVRSGRNLTLSYGGFMARRIARIAPPYLVALFGFALLSVSPFGLPTASVHADGARLLAELGFDSVFLTNRAPSFDAAFWTIGIEMRWYLLFPLLLALYVRSRFGFFCVGAACYALYFLTSWSVADAGTLPCFMLGIVAADLLITRPAVSRYATPLACAMLSLAIWQQAFSASVDHGNPLWHVCAFLIVVASGAPIVSRVLRFRPLAFVGLASYSVYLVHEPILKSLEWAHVPPPLCAAAALACGIAYYFLVERAALRPQIRGVTEALVARLGGLVRRPLLRIRSSTSG